MRKRKAGSYEADGFREMLEKLRGREKVLYRLLVLPEEEPVLKFPLARYLPTKERVGQDRCMNEMRPWAEFWRTPYTDGGRTLWTVQTQNKRFELLGKQANIPVRAIVERAEDAFALLGMEKESREFLSCYREMEGELPEALEWLLQHYCQIRPREDCRKFLQLGRCFRQGIDPGHFLREIHVPGLDTKFIERHQRLVCSLWTALHPDAPAGNMKELRCIWQMRLEGKANIGVRVLDARLGWHGVERFSLSAGELSKLYLPLKRVFITENKTNGQRFPRIPDSIILFGMGYGVLELADRAAWLRDVELFYWGDLDNNGFDILSKLREKLPKVQSMLMDQTGFLQKYASSLVEDTGSPLSHLSHLTVREKQVWKMLHERGLRLEQEKISMEDVEAFLDGLEEEWQGG